MKGSLIIVSFFIIGTLCGVYHLIPYDFTDSKLSYYALCGLMFCVKGKNQSNRFLLLPGK